MNDRNPKLVEAFSYQDYKDMFLLDDYLLERKILDFPGGFSSFNSEATRLNQHVVSLDPLYDLDAAMIENLIQQQNHLWQEHIAETASSTIHCDIAQQKYNHFKNNSKLFIEDYKSGKDEQRYAAWSPSSPLPFKNHTFQLALCSHWLFKQNFSLKETIDFIDELCRVAGEVRIFPLLNSAFDTPEMLGHLMANFQARRYQISCMASKFTDNNQSDAMLSIISPHCAL